MTSYAYYNEFDPFAAQWLRNLIAKGLIAPGEVDERSIVEVQPDDLKSFTQCHFFAGIGGWSLALRMSNWDDDRPVWTGSPPCQPFSTAGKQKGQDDDRHLWPAFFELIKARRPSVLFGEQVAAAIRFGWIDGVFTDLESEGYSAGAAIVPACAVNAPHKRDRLWFVADTASERTNRGPRKVIGSTEGQKTDDSNKPAEPSNRSVRALADADCELAKRLGKPGEFSSETEKMEREREEVPQLTSSGDSGERGIGGFWDSAQFILAPDGKARRIEPSIPLLVDGLSENLVRVCSECLQKGQINEKLRNMLDISGRDEVTPKNGEDMHICDVCGGVGSSLRTASMVSNRVGQLKAYGNAIVPHVAAKVISSYMAIRP